MKLSVKHWQLLGFISTSILGTILHFLYEWTHRAVFVAPFASINESTWEHMKLLFWPMIIFAFIQCSYFKENKNFWCIKAKSIMLGLVLIPTIYYTYNGAISKSPDWLNISIYYIAAAIAYIFEYKLLKKEVKKDCSEELAISLLCIIAFLFVIFTFITPNLRIFAQP